MPTVNLEILEGFRHKFIMHHDEQVRIRVDI
jgi:hypothetical protein